MNYRTIISCQNLGYSSQSYPLESPFGKWDVRELTLELYSYDRVCFVFNSDDQKEVLSRLFLKKLKPKTGSISSPSKIHIYSDSDFWEGADKKASINDNMKSKLFSNRPWFGRQRKNIQILIDRLDLGDFKQIPLSQLSFVQRTRLKILMMIAAKAKVILIDKLFPKLDEIGFLLFLEWLENYSGIIIYFGDIQSEHEENSCIRLINQDKVKSIFGNIILFSSDGTSKFVKLKIDS